MEQPSVFEYANFRDYLGELFEYKHTQNKRFTKAKICRDMGLGNTRSYFQDIINGKYLTPVKANLIAESFELNKGETKFFKVLVNFNQAFDDPQEREFCFEQLLAMKQASCDEIPVGKYEYYRKWYHSVIKMMLSIIDVSDNFVPLQKQLKQELTLREIQSSIIILNDLGLIYQNDKGFWKPSNQILTTPEYCESDLVKSYQIESLAQAQKSILINNDHNQRTITKMLSFSQTGQEKVMEALERFSNEINVIVSEDSDTEDRIYQMILTLFPHSQGV